jgi:hypothetical protein
LPLAAWALFLLRARGRSAAPALLALVAGAAVWPLAIIALLVRSGYPPWQWSGYRLWNPEIFSSVTSAFALWRIWTPNAPFGGMSHGGLAARCLLGLPSLDIHDQLGVAWPALGWIGALVVWRSQSRAGELERRRARWIATTLAAWIVLHLLVFGSYYYPAERFYLGPCALATLGFAAGCGLVAAAPRPWALPATAVALIALVAFSMQRPKLLGGPTEVPDPTVPRKVARWLAFTDRQRSERTVPFDPVIAQALGLLPPRVVARIGQWGRLPRTEHVIRLAGRGMIAAEEMAPPKEARRHRSRNRR